MDYPVNPHIDLDQTDGLHTRHARLMPGIHALLAAKTWMAGTSPAMTKQKPMSRQTQQTVIDFLARPQTYGGVEVTRIDTHAAAVFLAGNRALKIKRAVRFAVLDYSTLDKRKAACEAEIAVNHPFAPAIYRGVVAITRRSDGTLAIGGQGEPVEWAVEMRRFDETQTLDHLAEAGGIDAALADALGRAVARAHAAAPVNKDAISLPSSMRLSARTMPSCALRQNYSRRRRLARSPQPPKRR